MSVELVLFSSSCSATLKMSPIDFDYLALISDNDREFETELLGVYLDDGASHLDLARLALDTGNWEQLGKEAHHLKGASGNVGAKELQSLALNLEDASRSQDTPGARSTLARMMEQFQAVKQLFRERYGS